MNFPQRGELFWVRLNPTIGTGIAKTRPALIISNNIGNQYAERVIVALISTGNVSRIYPFEVRLETGEGGLTQVSKVLLDQIRTVDKSRLGNRIGQLPAIRMEEVSRAISLSLAV